MKQIGGSMHGKWSSRGHWAWLGVVVALPTVVGCQEEYEHTDFGEAHYLLHADPEALPSFVQDGVAREDRHDFVACLDKHHDRLDREALKIIDGCNQRCDGDAVCNFDCHTGQGTEIVEGGRDTLALFQDVLDNGGDLRPVMARGQAMAELICLAVNEARAFQFLPAVPCDEIWGTLRDEFVAEYSCTFKRPALLGWL